MGCVPRATTARESQISGPNASSDWGPHWEPGDGARSIIEASRETLDATVHFVHDGRIGITLVLTRERRNANFPIHCYGPAALVGCSTLLGPFFKRPETDRTSSPEPRIDDKFYR